MRLKGVVCIVALAIACGRGESPTNAGNQLEQPAPANATIRFVPIEGGCWTVVRDGSTIRYTPTNLPQEFKVDGKRVTVVFHEVPAMSICMIGPVVSIDHITAGP